MKVLVDYGTNDIGLLITNNYENRSSIGEGKYLEDKKGKSS